MESDGDDSDGVSKCKDDEFKLPRVMWVPDKAENQEDFLPRNKTPSCSNTNSSRRSTISGTSSNRTEAAPLSTTSARHLNASTTGLSTGQSSPNSPATDSLGSLMTQLGERFSRRNEARKKRAEMHEKLTSGKEQMNTSRMQQLGAQVGNGRVQQGDVTAQYLRKPPPFDQQNQPLTKQFLEPPLSREHIPDIKIISGSSSGHPAEKQRHPLARGDTNTNQHMNAATSAMRPTDTLSAQKRQKIGQSSFAETGAIKSMQKGIAIQQNSIHYIRQEHVMQQQPLPVKSTSKIHAMNRSAIPANQVTPAFRQQALISLPRPIAVEAPAVAEADNDIGQHHKSDTSFDSLNDMDGLFSGGGEEVEALFRACDGF
ncbi:hypothetical protein QFC21_004107 [Naganishia friedmannii]|uniref:Uncharacterized protein n=1 Tax=Naganishia friedmannii TaxID=89922 RepID=A0ACC2VL00_9TREE|nr:hypothetical protein QFC21_004107 [Naganishia friedmannii]